MRKIYKLTILLLIVFSLTSCTNMAGTELEPGDSEQQQPPEMGEEQPPAESEEQPPAESEEQQLPDTEEQPLAESEEQEPPESQDDQDPLKNEEADKITVSYYLGEGGAKITQYIITVLPDGLKAIKYEHGDTILSGFEDFDPLLNLIFAKKEGLWGLYDHAGEKTVEHVFEDIANYEMPDGYKPNGLVKVKKDGHWGAISQDGEIIIEPKYDSILLNYYEEVEPFVKVEKDNKFGYVTYDGQLLVDTIWDAAFMDVLNGPQDKIFVRLGEQWGGIAVNNEQATVVDWSLKPSEEAAMSLNSWNYQGQRAFYADQVRDGKTYIDTATKIFFNEYFRKNSRELRSLPAFELGESPNWDELTRFVYENYSRVNGAGAITKEQFAEAVQKYFSKIIYEDKSSHYLSYDNGKYTPVGWSAHGFYIYELTDLEKSITEDGQDKWKATLTGYYFYELDGEPYDEMQSKNAQAVWSEMEKGKYRGRNFYQACNQVVLNDPETILEPAVEWVVEFTVNDPWGDIYFTYLSCQSDWKN